MLDIAGLLDIAPGAVELVQLDSHLAQVLQVKRLQHDHQLCWRLPTTLHPFWDRFLYVMYFLNIQHLFTTPL